VVGLQPEHKRKKGRLSTHVLDTAGGRAAAGVAIQLYRIAPDGTRTLLVQAKTNADGRTDGPLLMEKDFVVGTYELVFAIGDYFRAQGLVLDKPAFLETVPIRFQLSDPGQTYHIPLVCSPWSYATYRGS
jgi:5-hydroxyisourate hydrolase